MKSRANLYNREEKQIKKRVEYITKESAKIIEQFRESIENIKKRFEIVELLEKQKLHEEASDILRFQIVYAMSALDFFMHEIYSYGLIQIFKNEKPKTNRYFEYKIPMKLIEKALYEPENIDNYLKEEFIELNSSYTFMSPSRIKELINIISPDDEFAKVERHMKNKNIISEHSRLDHVLSHIYERRNKISHQTDIDHGTDDRNKINKEEVIFYINIISSFGEGLYYYICEK